MKFISFILLFFSFSFVGKTQQYIPMLIDSSHWFLTYPNISSPPSHDYFEFFLQGDTTISNINYKKLYYRNEISPSGYENMSTNFSLIALLREDTINKKVYSILTQHSFCAINQEVLIYDFDKMIGDTIFPSSVCLLLDTFFVSNISSTNPWINSKSIFSNQHELYEGVGSYFGVIEPIYWSVSGPQPYLIDYCRGGKNNCKYYKNINKNQFAPIGAEWYYETGEPFEFKINYVKFEVNQDTIIKNVNTRKIECSSGNNVYPYDSILFVYDDSNVVYKYVEALDTFTTLYNFNADTSEYWVTQIDTNCSLTFYVDSVSHRIINNDTLKVQYVTIDSTYNQIIVEKFGNIINLLPEIYYPCYQWVIDDTYYTGLRCYSDSSFGFYNDFNNDFSPSFNVYSNVCDTNFVGLNELKNKLEITLYPNPTINSVNIKQKTTNTISQFFLFDVMGKLIITHKLKEKENTIDISHLTKGVYNYQIINDKNSTSGKLVIQ